MGDLDQGEDMVICPVCNNEFPGHTESAEFIGWHGKCAGCFLGDFIGWHGGKCEGRLLGDGKERDADDVIVRICKRMLCKQPVCQNE